MRETSGLGKLCVFFHYFLGHFRTPPLTPQRLEEIHSLFRFKCIPLMDAGPESFRSGWVFPFIFKVFRVIIASGLRKSGLALSRHCEHICVCSVNTPAAYFQTAQQTRKHRHRRGIRGNG